MPYRLAFSQRAQLARHVHRAAALLGHTQPEERAQMPYLCGNTHRGGADRAVPTVPIQACANLEPRSPRAAVTRRPTRAVRCATPRQGAVCVALRPRIPRPEQAVVDVAALAAQTARLSRPARLFCLLGEQPMAPDSAAYRRGRPLLVRSHLCLPGPVPVGCDASRVERRRRLGGRVARPALGAAIAFRSLPRS